MVKKKHISTPVLRYWHFQSHPFDDYILRKESLSMFVNREQQLHTLYNSLSSRLSGIYGGQGIGKSSFLRKMEKILIADNFAVVYIHLTGTTEKAIFREILSGILRAHLEGKIQTSKRLKINISQELDRVEHSIRLTKEFELGAAAVLTGNAKHVNEKSIAPHTESSATALIQKLIQHSETAFVVIVDDLERIKHAIADENTYFRIVTSFSRTVDELFSSKGVTFIVSLDQRFAQIIGNHKVNEDALSFSFGELIRLNTFQPAQMMELINVRLKSQEWNKSVDDFISRDAFWALMLATGGHARRSLACLRSAMEYVEMNAKPKKLDMDAVLWAIRRRGEIADETDLAIINYLNNSGPRSASDQDFQKAIGLGRPGLYKRLSSLMPRIYLEVIREGSGSGAKDVYELPHLQ